jgi:anti-sigma B factor antagonist
MSTPVLKHLKVKEVDGVAIVDFIDSGLMYESTLVQEIGGELQKLVSEHRYQRILLDFSRVQYLSSSMLGQLTKLEKELQKAKGQLKITGLGPVLHDTFRIGHFDSLFAIYATQEAALKAFRQ